VVRRSGTQPVAVHGGLDVTVHGGVVGVVEPVPLAALVRRAGHRLQVAVVEVLQVGGGHVAVGEPGPHLGEAAGGAVHRGLAVPHRGAAAGHVDHVRRADDAGRLARRVVGGVADPGVGVVGGSSVGGIEGPGEVADRVVL